MSRKRRRAVVLLVAGLASISLAALVPDSADKASADNANGFYHWGHGYRPYVSVPDSGLWHFTGEAEWGWSVNG